MSLLRKLFIRGSAKGTTIEADITSTNVDANTQAIDVVIKGSLLLSTGSATAAKQDVGNSSLTNLVAKDFATQTTLALLEASINNIYTKLQATIAVTGTFFQATQPVSNTFLNNQVGVWDYRSGISGTVVIPAGGKVVMISAIGQEVAASFTINGGSVIALPYGSTDKVSSAIEIKPVGNLVAPTIVFTSTKAYFIEFTT